MRVLVIEDNEAVAKIVARSLEREGFLVDTAVTAHDGGELGRSAEYSLIILDMILPDGHGISVLKTVRESGSATPILVVSGEGDTDTIVNALDAGADDYLQKPFSDEDLRARVRSLFHRRHLSGPPTVSCGNLLLNRKDRYASVAEKRLQLTSKEYTLLEYMVVNRDKVVPRADLLKKVWRFDFDPGTNMVDVNVSRLRAKLAGLGATCRFEAQSGAGYVFGEG
jgi:DNA-binding response OmpR family regulator